MRNDNYKSFIPTRMPNGLPYEFKFHHLLDFADYGGKIKNIKECFNNILEDHKFDIKALAELYVALMSEYGSTMRMETKDLLDSTKSSSTK